MIRAIVKHGAICPLDPLPDSWGDGEELIIDRLQSANSGADNLDAWEASMEALAARIPSEDFEALETALEAADQQAKALVRRQMGL